MWLCFDLKKRKVVRAWKQQCTQCLKESAFRITEAALLACIDHAVKKCLRRISDFEDIIHLNQPGDKDHLQKLCERCQELGRSCCGGAAPPQDSLLAALAGLKLTRRAEVEEEVAVDLGRGIPLPAAFAGFKSWDDVLRKSALTTSERDARSVAIQELRNVCEDTLKGTPNPCHKVKEAGSFAKGTDWLKSDVDVVVFVLNKFSAGVNRNALAAIAEVLQTTPGWVVGHINSHSLSCHNEPIDCHFDVLIGGLTVDSVSPSSPNFFLGLKKNLHRLWAASACSLQKKFMLEEVLQKRKLERNGPDDYRKVKSSFQGAVRLLKLWADNSGLNCNDQEGGRKWKMRSYLFEILLARVLLPLDPKSLQHTSSPQMFQLCMQALADPADTPLRVALPFKSLSPDVLMPHLERSVTSWKPFKGRGRLRRERGAAEVALDPANPNTNVADDHANPYDIPFLKLRERAVEAIFKMS